MPAGISSLPPSSYDFDPKNAPAFTVIPKDNLESSLPILHINYINHIDNDFAQYKNERNNLQSRKRISRSNDHLVLASLQNSQTNPLRRKPQSRSHDRLSGCEKKCDNNLTKPLMSMSTENFNDILTSKLRKIQDEENNPEIQISGKKGQVPLKKPFITTVKTGEFLLPPPEVAALLGMAPNGTWIGHDHDDSQHDGPPRSKFRPLVSLGRRPEVRHSSHNARCQAALKATVDFAVNIVNSTASTASTLANEERVHRRNTNRFAENDQQLPFGNIMFDRRVVRGSTFATAPVLVDDEQSQAARQAEARRKQQARKRCQAQASRSMLLRMSSPPPVPGRKHEPVQTELYLEELFEKPQESEVATQTDYFQDRPATPPFHPGKVGVDAETQIGPGDLFDYDAEVQPILEVLVGKTIEQALIEVLEEEELAAIKEQQRRFLELRAAEKAEEQRLEEQERRIREEKDRRLREHEEALKAQQETEERVAAAVLLTGYIAELLPSVLDNLKTSGFLLDDIGEKNEETFMPWLVDEVKKEMDTMVDSRELLSEIIKEILEKRGQVQQDSDASTPKSLPESDKLQDGAVVDYVNFENYEKEAIEEAKSDDEVERSKSNSSISDH